MPAHHGVAIVANKYFSLQLCFSRSFAILLHELDNSLLAFGMREVCPGFDRCEIIVTFPLN